MSKKNEFLNLEVAINHVFQRSSFVFFSHLLIQFFHLLQLENTFIELEECRRNLTSCLDENAKLSR